MRKFSSILSLTITITLGAACSTLAVANSPHVCSADSRSIWGDTISWDSETGPVAREHAIMLYDNINDRIILFGGSGYNPQLSPLADAWAFQLESKTWRQLEVAGDAPDFGGSRRAAKLDQDGRTLIFGGYDSKQSPLDDLLELHVAQDTLTFKKVEQMNTPPSRFLHAFVRSNIPNHFYAFGGVGTQFYNDTWQLVLTNGKGTWAQIDTASNPSARYGFSYFVDQTRNEMIVVGGADQKFPEENPSDAWRFSLGENNIWAQITNVDYGTAVIGRRNPHFSYDSGQRQLLLYGGTSDGRSASKENGFLKFKDEGLTWLELPEGGAESRASGMAIFDPVRNIHWVGFGNAAKRYQDITPILVC